MGVKGKSAVVTGGASGIESGGARFSDTSPNRASSAGSVSSAGRVG